MGKGILFVAALILGFVAPASACNLSSYSFVSMSMSGSNYEITTSFCLGAGRTGVAFGGDGPTMDLMLGIYRSAGPVNIVSFSPTALVSSFTGCNMDGYDIGPVPSSPFFTDASLYYYFDPFAYPACSNGFTCVSSTALCGNIHADCFTIILTLDAMPDSIRMFGAEGAGNPIAGCTPNPDMVIEFSNLSMAWTGLSAQHLPGKGVQVDWACRTPDESGQFAVERKSLLDTVWRSLTSMDAPAQSSEPAMGTYLDTQPLLGKSQYRIRHVLPNGISQTSEAMEVNVASTRPTLSPNPVSDDAILQTGLPEPAMGTIEIVGIDGRRHLFIEGELKSYMELELHQLPPGIYHVGVMLPGNGTTWLRMLKQ